MRLQLDVLLHDPSKSQTWSLDFQRWVMEQWVKLLDSRCRWWKLWIGSAVWCDNWRCFIITVLSLWLISNIRIIFPTSLHDFYFNFSQGIGRSRLMASGSSGGLCKETNILYKLYVVMKPKLKKLELPSDFSVVTLGFLNLNLMMQMFPCSVKGCFLRFIFFL